MAVLMQLLSPASGIINVLWCKTLTRRLAITNRLRVCICTWPCKNLPNIEFDHAKFVCCLLCAYVYDVPKIWDGSLLIPTSMLCPHVCYHTKLCHSRSNSLGIGRDPKNWGMMGPCPLELCCGWPLETRPSPICYYTRFCRCRSNVWCR